MKKKDLLVWVKLLDSLDSTLKRSGRWLTRHQFFAIEHLPDKEELISRVFKNCVVLLFMVKRSKSFQKKIFYILVSQQGSKWTTFLDKLITCDDLNTLTIYLFKMLVQELILKGKEYQPFWTPAYEELSEKLLLPTRIDCVDSDLNSLNQWSPKQEEELPSCKITQVRLVNKNLQTTCWPSFMSSHVDKWGKEIIEEKEILKCFQVTIYPTENQKQMINEFIDTSRFVYNKTIRFIKEGHKVNWMNLRNLIVTNETSTNDETYKKKKAFIAMLHRQKTETDDKAIIAELDDRIINERKALHCLSLTIPKSKNPEIEDFELKTPKDVRTCAVQHACSAYKSGFSNLKKGNIKFFNMKFKKKTEPKQWMMMTPKNIKIDEQGNIRILPTFMKEECILRTSNRNKEILQGMTIENDVTLCRKHGLYTLQIPIPAIKTIKQETFKASSIDLGLRTGATCYTVSNSEHIVAEYFQPREKVKQLNKKIDSLNANKVRKRKIMKYENKKIHLIDQFHWMLINDLLKNNDAIFLGDIKSHDIVKKGKNKTVNREFNDMRFGVLKQRLMYKASLCGVHVVLIPEPYTSKTCSKCGCINEVGGNKNFVCVECSLSADRDANASKNIFMKAILSSM